MSFIQSETTTVFRDPLTRKRFLTKHSAYLHRAKQFAKKKCECIEPDYPNGDYGSICGFHSKDESAWKGIKRLARLYKYIDSKNQIQWKCMGCKKLGHKCEYCESTKGEAKHD